tara:strand:+ start:377 stop:871 length:495 start_codon:yes stop_codon:yes gene_type:complete
METKNIYVSFQEWKENFFEIEKKDLTETISDKWGVAQEMLFEDTKTIRIYKKGGYLEILNNGLFTVGLDRSIYENKELEPIEKELYKWCNGEIFNLYNGWASNTNNIANQIMQECEKDTDYLFEIVHEYLQLLEDTPIGLKGIKETLEERNSFEKIYESKSISL